RPEVVDVMPVTTVFVDMSTPPTRGLFDEVFFRVPEFAATRDADVLSELRSRPVPQQLEPLEDIHTPEFSSGIRRAHEKDTPDTSIRFDKCPDWRPGGVYREARLRVVGDEPFQE